MVNLIGKEGLIKLEDINNKLKLANNIFNTHINELIKSGIISINENNLIDFALPRFEQFLETNIDL